MLPNGKKAANGKSNDIDRLSDLPDSILHRVILHLDSDESCRTTILSKRWSHIWSTGLVLEFKPHFFEDKHNARGINDPYSNETIDRLIHFIETTMLRYSNQNLSIRMFELESPIIDQQMLERIGRWFGIAVQNNVEALSFCITPEAPPTYDLPGIVFAAKSLLILDCCRVRMPYYRVVKLVSLQHLILSEVDINERMLQYLIISCPLKGLRLFKCSGFKDVLIRHCSSLELLDVAESVPLRGKIVVDAPSLQYFSYDTNASGTFKLMPASMKSLRELCISCVNFNRLKDKMFDQFISSLTSIKFMTFSNCGLPKDISIASKTLKELNIVECDGLIKIVTDAPELDTFKYIGDLKLSSVIISHVKFNTYLSITEEKFDTQAFVKLRMLLSSLKCCKVLEINVRSSLEFETNEDRLSKIWDVIHSDVKELKLSLWDPIHLESSLKALIDGLFWICRPNILSLLIAVEYDNKTVKKIMEILEKKVKYWKDPLKCVEVEGTDCSSIFESGDLDLRLKLFW